MYSQRYSHNQVNHQQTNKKVNFITNQGIELYNYTDQPRIINKPKSIHSQTYAQPDQGQPKFGHKSFSNIIRDS